jgi:hypothetical protein
MTEATFLNEKGNQITMSVRAFDGEVVVDCTGPSSRTVHRWTTMEAQQLRDMIALELVAKGHDKCPPNCGCTWMCEASRS